MSFHPMESPPDDPDVCEECGTALEHDQDGDYDSDGYVVVTSYTYCPNDDCPTHGTEAVEVSD